uniref:CRAL-TRIO domain-containing protein n=2 Tax=Phaeomonas parva TaxID=124430 RepID=A0A7S1TZS9_9STRA|mmetsp:Transcript_24418/g.76567  ORF Transcript_24418/g.76567 Transcript_24418/m.76567 type:complete len:917 (+) Transcript_24418:139-2889(+)
MLAYVKNLALGRGPDPRQSLALFLDALSRSYVLPFAPFVVGAVANSYRAEITLWARLCAVYLTARLVGRAPVPSKFAQYMIWPVGVAWAVAIVGFAYGKSESALYWARFAAGFAGSFLSKTTSVLLDGTPEQERNEVAIGSIHVGGHVSRPWIVGAVVGPLLGGILYQVKGVGVASLAVAAALVLALPAIAHYKDIAAMCAPLCQRRAGAAQPLAEKDEELKRLLDGDRDVEMGAPGEPGTSSICRNVGPHECPKKYLENYKGNEARALKAWRETLQFRKELRLDTLFDRPPFSHFDAVKQNYPHTLHGIARKGEVVNYERAGDIDLPGLTANNLSAIDLTDHMMYCNEFLIQKIFGDFDEAKLVTILDAKGVSFSHVSGQVFEFLRISGARVETHYPCLVKGIIVVNAPFWFANSWGMVMKMLPESYKEKVNILGSNYYDELTKRIAPNQIPDEYGGTGGPLNSHYFEFKLREAAKNAREGKAVEVIGTEVPEGYLEGAGAPRGQLTQGETKSPTTSPRGAAPRSTQKSASNGGGILSFFRATPKAHLGDSNRFHFDHTTQSWVLDDGQSSDEDISSTPHAYRRVRSGSFDEEEEENLVAAIQAAQFHRRGPKTDLEDDDMKGDDFILYPSAEVVVEKVANDELMRNSALAQRCMVICICVLYAASCVLQTALEVVIPLWLLTATNGGGIGLDPETVGIAGLVAGLYFFVMQYFLPSNVTRMWTRAPVRAYRIGCGGICAVFALLIVCPRTFLATQRPLVSLQFWFLLCPLLALLATALASLRSAASVLLQLCLKASELPPQQLTSVIGLSAEILGALAGGAAFSLTAGHTDTHAFLDSRFFFAVSALTCAGLYLVSLLLHMHVVGGADRLGAPTCFCVDVADIPSTDMRNLLDDARGEKGRSSKWLSRRSGKHL